MNELALFAGAGGGILGGHLLGWRTVCAVEWEAYPASVLCARQNDGLLPPFPIWDDVQTFDGKPWRGIVDVVSGGFPCQDISAAGKGAGIDGERSGMWGQMARIISEVRPKYAFIENSPMLTSRGLERVLADLAKLGFDAEWGVLGAAHVGAPHLRERIWICAKQRKFLPHSNYNGLGWRKQQSQGIEKKVDAYAGLPRLPSRSDKTFKSKLQALGEQSWGGFRSGNGYKENASIICGVNDGMANRVDRLKAIGNGQVPLCAATAWELLMERLENGRN
jgi:DNA (cytosine-5)-methyltransferase 1